MTQKRQDKYNKNNIMIKWFNNPEQIYQGKTRFIISNKKAKILKNNQTNLEIY